MAILVCGGAGYIGSHNVRALLARGEETIIIDNFLTGHRGSVPAGARLYEGDIRDAAILDQVFGENDIDAVLHFAASSLVGESMEKPLKYFNNNVHGMQMLLEAMLRHDVDKLVFSSSAAVYGEPERVPIEESDPTRPCNPYGESKLIMETIMRWVGKAHHIRSVSLRYFNVAGAWPGGEIGEDHRPESHLIPLILQVPLGLREQITVFGQDYPTPDGTCIRDYLDVTDLADAHLRAVDYLRRGGASEICNLGNGRGFSVMEMIEAARRVTGQEIKIAVGPRRPGDPARLVASAARAAKVLDWRPETGLEDMIASAWEWHKNHPHGYAR
ncbi:UDP-glucose 4-epimerase GalE [Desulfovibrio sp. ZJ200]|uniref:UDP-glucose 4-epimerase GalE n=1 Tax=Desulfovibrio sp. ZJ200 TaxID=2709792 RepID=UPI0013EDFAA9|nr:UDP-glucose 4-epimerase GalE [Desulfovibrio sp. ZJ200]